MIAGRYRLDREIGRGGMGAVWLAEDTTLGREVAIKRLGGMGTDTAPDLDRAAREARLAARLNHPHVVHVFDLVDEERDHWLVMEYVEGQTLSAMIRAEGALSTDRAASLIGQAADALAAAHAAGIVHRDVKPSNMLVADDVVKLSDFGIARAEADASLTQTGLVTGSPAYLSPEVASGHMATPASDVWSLGATLYHALSGQPPYEVGDNLMGALFRIVHEDPPRVARAGWLAPLLEATMTREPGERWTMAQVRDFLRTRGAEVPLARPPATTATQTMPVTRVATPAPVPRDPVPSSPAAPAEVPTTRSARPTPGRGWLALAVAAVLVVVLGVGAWQLLRSGGETTPTIDRPSAGASDRPSDDASGTQGPAQPTAQGMRAFITDYLATAPDSPETGFEMLTPSFQSASGGLDGYEGYWSTIATAEPAAITADPESLVVSYDVAYTRRDGSRVDDRVELRLEYDDGRYRIAAET